MSKKSIFILIIAFVGISFSRAGEANTADIQHTFNQFTSAVQARKGIEAAKWVDKKTFRYFEYILKKAQTAKNSELKSIPYSTRLTILQTRLDFKLNEMKKLTGKELFIHQLNKPWNHPLSDIDTTLQFSELTSKQALAHVKGVLGLELLFVKESDGWKFSFWNLTTYADQVIQLTLQFSPVSEDMLIHQTLSSMNKGPVDQRIFNGPLK